jgi:Tol biopolymer transport system component
MNIQEIGKEKSLLDSPQTKGVSSWSADGRYLLYTARNERVGNNLWVKPFFGEGNPYRVVQRNFEQNAGSLSPQDSQWILYESTDSGQSEIYLQRFSESGDRLQVSLAGGDDPRWRSDGKEIFYVALDGTLMAASVSVTAGGKQIQPETPVGLFQTPLTLGIGREHGYAVSADGQRFLIPIPVEKSSPPITLLLNWANPRR